MKNRHSRGIRSIFFSWLTSYLLLIIVPFLSIFLNFHFSSSAFKEEYTNYYTTSLQAIRDNFDIKLDNLKGFRNYIRLNNNYEKILVTNKKTNNFYFTAYSLFNDLTIYQGMNSNLGWYLYNTTLDETVTCNNFPFQASSETDLTETSYKSDFFFYKSSHSFSLIYADTVRARTDGKFHTLVSLDSPDFQAILDNIPSNISLVISYDDQSIWLDKNGILQEQDDVFHTDTNGAVFIDSDYMYISVPSEKSTMIYYYVIPRSTISDNMAPIRTTFIWILTATAILSILLILFLLNKNYEPLDNLLSKLSIPNVTKNEYYNLEAYYNSMDSNIKSMNTLVNKQKNVLLSNWLLSVLKGRTSPNELIKQANFYNLAYDRHFGLLGIFINPEKCELSTYNDLYFFIVNNIFSEVFSSVMKPHKIEDGFFIYYLFMLDEANEAEWYETAMKKSAETYEFINAHYDLDMTVVVGHIANSLYDCKYSYNEISNLFSLHYLYGDEHIIDIRDYSIILNEKHSSNTINERLANAVKNGSIPEILSTNEEFFHSLEGQSFVVQKLYVYDSFNSIVQLFNLYSSNSSYKMKLIQHIEPIMNATDFQDLKDNFENALTYVCRTIASASHSESNIIVDRIKQYIIHHYTDQNLCVSLIADELQKNPKYLSRVFKENTGVGILDYINTFRITKAIEIVSCSEHLYNMETLSHMVGYSNVQAFRRAFIKMHDVTPGTYFKNQTEQA